MKISSSDTLGIFSFDAGGAELLANLIKDLPNPKKFFVSGPAISVFLKYFPKFELAEFLGDLLDIDILISSTSWQSDLCFNGIKAGKEKNIKTIVVLDHWIYFEDRFQRENETIAPDEIWVVDEMALSLIKTIFPSVPVKIVANKYFEVLKNEARELCIQPNPSQILYVCEPISEHAKLRYGNPRKWGYTEIEALNYFLDNLENLGMLDKKIIIRPHPSEPQDKYDWLKEKRMENISLSDGKPLIHEITKCSSVVGCESMAMVVALELGKKVYSSIPPGGRECVLPHESIEKIKYILENKR